MSKETDSPAKAAEGDGGALSPAPKSTPQEPTKDGKKTATPAEWSVECGHIDPGLVFDPLYGAVMTEGRRPASDLKGWMFAAAKAKAGWGTRFPDDQQITRDEYEAAVKAALDTPVGEAKSFAKLAAIEAEVQAQKAGKKA